MMIKIIKEIWNSLESEQKQYLSLALFLIGITGFLSIFILPFLFTLNAPFRFMKYSVTSSNVANTINGIAAPFIALTSTIITFLAFWVQYQANIQQKEQFKSSLKETRTNYSRGQIESRFFELLKIHISNQDNVIQKLGNFHGLVNKLQELIFTLESINTIFPSKLTDHQINNIAYNLFFYGFYEKTLSGNYTLQRTYKVVNKCIKLSDNSVISQFLEKLEERLKQGENNITIENYEGTYDILGHYYRNLFQTVKYINSQSSTLLSYQDKYQYIKILRAQLTTSEQLLFFYNAISELGKSWELDESLDENRKLITKYDLIKNIPVDIQTYPKIKDYFPLVYFETDIKKSEERLLFDKELS